MKLTSSYKIPFPHAFDISDAFTDFEVTLRSSSGHLNPQTGDIISHEEIIGILCNWRDTKLSKVNSIYEFENLEYLPHTPEIVIGRLWEWIEELLPFSAKLVGLKVWLGSDRFVQYSREEPVLVQEPQPKTQPKFRKQRKKSGRQKSKKSNNSD